MPADSFLPWQSSKREFEEPLLEEARALLEADGYKGEAVKLAYRTHQEERDEALWLQERCRKIGLLLELCPVSEYDLPDLINQADLVICEEVLEDDWQWGMINYFRNESNYLHHLLLDSQKSELTEVLKPFARQAAGERAEVLELAEGKLRANGWVLYGCHMNKKRN